MKLIANLIAVFTLVFSLNAFAKSALELTKRRPKGHVGQAAVRAVDNKIEAKEKEALEKKVKEIDFSGLQFKECKAIGVLDHDAYVKDRDFWDQAINQCGIQVQVAPETSWFSSFLGKMASPVDEKTSADFLKKVGERAKQYAVQNNNNTEYLLACASNDKAWFEAVSKKLGKKITLANCKNDLEKLKQKIQSRRKEQRVLISLSNYGNLIPAESVEAQLININVNLDQRLGVISPKMSPLFAAEEKEATDRFVADTKKIDGEFNQILIDQGVQAKRMRAEGMPESQIRQTFPALFEKNPKMTRFYLRFRGQEREKLHTEYRDKYVKLVSDVPVMMYLSKNSPSDQDLVPALKKVLENGREQVGKIDHSLTYFNKEGKKANFSTLTELMKYGPVVRSLLKEDAKSCGVATAVMNQLAQKDISRNGAMIVGTLGFVPLSIAKGPALLGISASALNSALLGVAAVTPLAVETTASDILKANDLESRVLSVADTTEGSGGHALGDVKELTEGRDSVVTSLALFPTNYIGLGVVKGAGILAGGAAAGLTVKTAERFLERSAARNAIVKGLRAKGMEEKAVETVMQDLKSGDAARASKAGATIVKNLEIDPKEIDMVRVAANHNLLSADKDDPLKYINLMMKDLPENVKERKLATRVALDILEKTNGAKINEANRKDIAKAVVAAANLGHPNPEHVGRLAIEWAARGDGSLKNWSEVMRLAKQEIGKREIASVSDPAERVEKAIESALDKMRKDSPAFSKMSDAEWAQVRQQMARECGIGGGKA